MNELHTVKSPARCVFRGQVAPRALNAAYLLRLWSFDMSFSAMLTLKSQSGRVRLDKQSGHFVGVARLDEVQDFKGLCFYELGEVTSGAVNAIATGLFAFDDSISLADQAMLDQIALDSVVLNEALASGNGQSTTGSDEDDLLIYARYYLARMVEAGSSPSVLTP
jgi:hypothetical protein